LPRKYGQGLDDFSYCLVLAMLHWIIASWCLVAGHSGTTSYAIYGAEVLLMSKKLEETSHMLTRNWKKLRQSVRSLDQPTEWSEPLNALAVGTAFERFFLFVCWRNRLSTFCIVAALSCYHFGRASRALKG
jgi:hypothetical protein